MTAATISALLEYIPSDALLSQLGSRVQSPCFSPDADAVRFTQLYSAPDFGWTFCRLIYEQNIPFPGGLCFARDEVLFRAYLHLINPKLYRARDIQAALAIRCEALNSMRVTLEGLLLARGATTESVAILCNLPPEVVNAYERLFFNVLDRRTDVLYLQQLIYPHGRLVEMLEGYFERESLGNLVRRAGFNNGPGDVMFFMGASESAIEALHSANTAQQYERMVMAFGYMIARNGGVSQRGATAVQNARALVQAGKLGGDTSGKGAISEGLSRSLDLELQRYARPAQQMRAAHQGDYIDVEN